MEKTLHKNTANSTEQVMDATTYKTAAERPPTSHHENYQN